MLRGTRSVRGIVALRILCLALGVGLFSCARYPVERNSPLQGSIYPDEPVPVPEPPVTNSNAERHAFAIAERSSMVGTLAILTLRPGDTLPDVARHFGLGYEEIVAANPELDPWLIDQPTRAWVPLQFVLPQVPRKGLVINLAAPRLYHFPAPKRGIRVVTYPVGIGREGRTTPTGGLSIVRKATNPTWHPTRRILDDHLKLGNPLPAAVPPGPDNPLGAYALYLSAARYLIHGTNKPYAVGLRASNGCIRLYPEDVEALFPTVRLKEPVTIVNQPYLIGVRGGHYYLQAYQPHEELDEPAARQQLREKLKGLETEHRLVVDWQRVEQTLNEARGIPVPIDVQAPDLEALTASATELPHPGTFFGQPRPPLENPNAWHVIAAETESEIAARRTAAVLQHLGLPARQASADKSFRVIVGPFSEAKNAKKAAMQLRGDLELDGRVVAPGTDLAEAILPAVPSSPEPAVPALPPPDAGPSTPASPEEASPYEGTTPPESAVPAERDPETTAPAGAIPAEPAPEAPEPYYGTVPEPEDVPAEPSRPEPGVPETTEPADSQEPPVPPNHAPPLEYPPDVMAPSVPSPAPGAGE